MNSIVLSPWKIWFDALRPRTLPLAASAIILGFCLAALAGSFKPGIAFLALICAVLLQILSNLANDYGDAMRGSDQPDRLGPQRAVASGLTSPESMKRAVALAALLALASGILLIAVATRGRPQLSLAFLILGLACIAAALAYTLGKRPYGYSAWGDFMAGFFFGPVAVLGAALLCGQFHPLMIWPALSAAFCSTSVLNINNLRDIDQDRRAGKISMAVRLGREKDRRYHALLTLSIVLGWAIFLICLDPACLPALVLALPLICSAVQVIGKPADPANLNRQLKNTVLSSALLNAGLGLLCLLFLGVGYF